jgi:type IV fimbrial biogenesis protein FimT
MTSRRTLSRMHSSGFTVIEVMIAVAVLAVLISLAAPGFQSFIVSTRLTGQVNDLIATLSLARSEAAARGRTAQVCQAASATSCSSTAGDNGWASGYIVWADTNGNSAMASTEIIKYIPPLDGGVSVTASNSGPIAFRAFGGLVGSSTWTFTFCSPGEVRGREITVPATGRATAKRIETCT